MIEFRREALFPTRVCRRRVRPTNVAPNDLGGFSQSSQCPLKIGNGETATLPVRHGLFSAEAIQIDSHIQSRSFEVFQKLLKVFAPILTEHRALALSIFRRPIVCPRMHFKNARPFSATVTENLVRPPALEITATPNTRAPHVREFQCATDPATTSPFRQPHIPIRMIVERHEDHRYANWA